jgi:serine/threonine protein kinase
LAGAVERIAHYRILKRIGRGGMGIVYQAVDERDGRTVALKVIREAEGPGDESAVHQREARVRFDREAAILKGLLHVNVVTFYEIGEEDGTPWLAMEYLDGAPLTSYAGKPWTETLPLLVQAAHGMEYLASRGIVHRDLSPDNILVIERGGDLIVKLLDFGIAKLFEHPTGLEALTATGFFLGKVAYGSPEQLGALGHGAALDWRSDVYSLGVIFYQVLAGQRPFEGKAPVEYIAAHLNATAPPVAAPHDAPPLPVPLVRLIGQMLEKRREDRPGGWQEIVDRLVAVLRSSGSTARIPETVGGPRETVPAATGQTALVARRPPVLPQSPWRVADARRLASVSAVALILVLAATWYSYSGRLREIGPPDSPRRRAVAARPTAAPAAATPAAPVPAGRLRILALPFARVRSIVDEAGRSVPLPKDATTPLLLRDLAPGVYRVVLTGPDGGRSVERRVEVTAGASELLSEPFETPSSLAQMLRTEGSRP